MRREIDLVLPLVGHCGIVGIERRRLRRRVDDFNAGCIRVDSAAMFRKERWRRNLRWFACAAGPSSPVELCAATPDVDIRLNADTNTRSSRRSSRDHDTCPRRLGLRPGGPYVLKYKFVFLEILLAPDRTNLRPRPNDICRRRLQADLFEHRLNVSISSSAIPFVWLIRRLQI